MSILENSELHTQLALHSHGSALSRWTFLTASSSAGQTGPHPLCYSWGWGGGLVLGRRISPPPTLQVGVRSRPSSPTPLPLGRVPLPAQPTSLRGLTFIFSSLSAAGSQACWVWASPRPPFPCQRGSPGTGFYVWSLSGLVSKPLNIPRQVKSIIICAFSMSRPRPGGLYKRGGG